jgi:hypothetical protein
MTIKMVTTIVKNHSVYPVDCIISGVHIFLRPKEMKRMNVQEGDRFQAKTPKGKVDLGKITLLRSKKDQAGDSYIGHLEYPYPTSKDIPVLDIGKPLEYLDDQIYSQKASLKSHTGGVPWVDIINMTNASLTFQDGLESPAATFEIPPGERYRYMGRYHWGVNYGTFIKNIDGVYETAQIMSPITHLMYGVL